MSDYTISVTNDTDIAVVVVSAGEGVPAGGTAGQVLIKNSSTDYDTAWGTTSGSGTVVSASVVTANGLAGTVANPTSTPAITLSTTVTGVLKGNGTAISAATAGTDYADNAFKTISVSGQSDIVADSASDTLTLVAGSNITITTNAGTDAITINSTASGSGDVVGPASSVDNSIVRMDGITGKLIQDSAVTIADTTGDITGGKYNTVAISGSSTPTLAVTGTSAISGTNTGDNAVNSLYSGLVSNATHTGEVTGSTALTVDKTAITGKTTVTAVGTDYILISDTSDSGNLKKALASDLTGGGSVSWGSVTGTLSDQTDLQTALDSKVDENAGITGATKTKITYDAKGLVTAGADATTADIADSSNKRYVTDAQLVVIGNTSGTNTGDQTNITGNAATVTTNANLTGPITSVGNATSIASQTGTGTTFAMSAGPTFTGNVTIANITGATQLIENSVIMLDQVLSADGTFTGEAIDGTAGAALAFGDMVQYSSTDSRWELCSVSAAADAAGDCRGLIGSCILAAAGDGSATRVLLKGNIRADANFPTLTVGKMCFLTTSGDITQTAPSTEDHVIRPIGFAISADSIMFQPSTNWATYKA